MSRTFQRGADAQAFQCYGGGSCPPDPGGRDEPGPHQPTELVGGEGLASNFRGSDIPGTEPCSVTHR